MKTHATIKTLWVAAELDKPYRLIKDVMKRTNSRIRSEQRFLDRLMAVYDEHSSDGERIAQVHTELFNEGLRPDVGLCLEEALIAFHEEYVSYVKALFGEDTLKVPRVAENLDLSIMDEYLAVDVVSYYPDVLTAGDEPALFHGGIFEVITKAISELYELATTEGQLIEWDAVPLIVEYIVDKIGPVGQRRLHLDFWNGAYLCCLGKPKSYWVEKVLGDEA